MAGIWSFARGAGVTTVDAGAGAGLVTAGLDCGCGEDSDGGLAAGAVCARDIEPVVAARLEAVRIETAALTSSASRFNRQGRESSVVFRICMATPVCSSSRHDPTLFDTSVVGWLGTSLAA